MIYIVAHPAWRRPPDAFHFPVRAIACVAYLFAIGVPLSPLLAASFGEIRLKLDGSIAPPGDVITLSISFAPDDAELDVIVDAFTVDSGSGKVISRVPTGEQSVRDSNGGFHLTRTVTPQEISPQDGNITIIIPYSALALPVGSHRIGYVLSLRRPGNNKIVAQSPTRLSVVEVSDGILQRTIQRPVQETVDASVHSELTVLVPEDGTLTERKILVEDRKPVTSQSTVSETYPVLGGFVRSEIIRYRTVAYTWSADPEADTDPRDADADYLENRPWIPLRERRILFATNRQPIPGETRPGQRFGNNVHNRLSYGTAVVNIPVEEHRRGTLETPSWWEKRDPKEHFFLVNVLGLDRDRFRNIVCNPLEGTKDDVLLFIHGYNTTFEFACLRTAQITHDLEFAGSPILFSWPSKGRISGYRDDEDAAGRSTHQLAQLLADLSAGLASHDPASRIHIIAHSMGNRVLLAAVSLLDQQTGGNRGRLGHVILAAPDVDLVPFSANYPALTRQADSASLYFCNRDRALTFSQIANQQSRLGQRPMFLPDLINIDASKVDTSILAHGYFASRSELLIDIEHALAGLAPDDVNRRTIRRLTFTSAEVPVGSVLWAFP